MTKRYFVTHSAGHCPCDSISKELDDGSFEELTYQDIVDLLNENELLKSKINVFAECVNTANTLNEKIDVLERENEQLKQQLENGLCHMCGASLKNGGIDMPKGDVE